MKIERAVWKIHSKGLVFFGFALCLLAITSILAIKEGAAYRNALAFAQSLQADEQRLKTLKMFVQEIDRYESTLKWLSAPKEAIVDEEILLEPFGTFLSKLRTIYEKQGFFFLESMEITTCLEIKNMALIRKEKCIPVAHIKGRVVSFFNDGTL